MSEAVRDAIEELSPAGKLVFKILEYNDGMTQKQLVERSRLSARTVRNVLDDLAQVGAVREAVYPPDARQTLYELTDPVTETMAAVGVDVPENRASNSGMYSDD